MRYRGRRSHSKIPSPDGRGSGWGYRSKNSIDNVQNGTSGAPSPTKMPSPDGRGLGWGQKIDVSFCSERDVSTSYLGVLRKDAVPYKIPSPSRRGLGWGHRSKNSIGNVQNGTSRTPSHIKIPSPSGRGLGWGYRKIDVSFCSERDVSTSYLSMCQ